MFLRRTLMLGLVYLFATTATVAVSSATAMAQAPAATAGTRVHGTITDPDGELIPGATISLTPAKGNATKIQSGSDGTYSVSVAPGTYTLVITMPGFASYLVNGLKIPAVPSTTVDAKMKIGEQEQVVNVESTAMTLSVDADSNASATIITGKDLEALSDDPDELSSELQALAGPSAGPNGGQIYVDGFTGGQLPPKSSIREIRVNQNPFSAEYDKLGFGRVEVFTKPGTDKFHGSAQVNGNYKGLNTGDPLLLPGTLQPSYHTLFLLGQLTGPINKKSSFSAGGSFRQIQIDSIFNGTLYAASATAQTPCAPGAVGCAPYSQTIAIFQPQTRFDFTPRLDLQITPHNTMTVRYQVEHGSETNSGTGNFTLLSAGSDTASTENTIQATDNQTVTQHIINETRFEFQRDSSSTTPLNTGLTYSVGGAFTGGASSGQTTNDNSTHIEVQNYTSVQLKSNFIRAGGRFRSTRQAEYSNSGSNGTLSYACVTPVAASGTFGTSNYSPGCSTAYSTNTPQQFSITQINKGSVLATLADLGLYAEDDWKPKKNLSISYGIRYETQNYISDHHDFAPRLSFAYGLFAKSGNPKTVVRGGYGLFYDRFAIGNVVNTLQNNGVNQLPLIVSNPTPGCTTAITCGATPVNSLSTNSLDPKLRSSIIGQSALGVDEQLGKIGTISVNYLYAHGTHEFNSLDLSLNGQAPVVNGSPVKYAYQYQSEGLFNQHQISFSPRIQISKRVSISGYYVLNFAKSDSSGASYLPSQPNNLKADYGRASFDTRHRMFLFGNFSLPHLITVSPLLSISSGNPYNIYTGIDTNGDGSLSNDRPTYAACSAIANASTTTAAAKTAIGKFCGFNNVSTALIPLNLGTGPNSIVMNVRILKTFGLGGPMNPNNGQQGGGDQGGPGGPGGGQGGGARGGGGAGGGPGGGGGGGGRGGGGGGGGRGGGASSGKRYNLSFGLNVANVFNDVDLAAPTGNLSSSKFGQSTQLAGGFATTVNAVRRITLQTSFTF